MNDNLHIKGNVLVGQSGGPTAVINSSLAGVFAAAKKLGADKVLGMINGIEGILSDKYTVLDETLKTDFDVELLKHTPSSFLGSCRYKLPKPEKGNEIYEKLFTFFKEHNITCCFYIGGNDSMDTVGKLYDYACLVESDIRFVGVPKTIDNDLEITDHTPGYGSAAKYIATVTKELVRDGLVYDLKSVTVVEIMGRDSGWLTAAAALARGDDCEGADMILLPERPINAEFITQRVEQLQKEKKSLVIAVSEGVRTPEGEYLCAIGGGTKDIFGHTQLSGTGQAVAAMLKSQLGIKTRAVELSTLQRCASHIASITDIEEAFSCGAAAVKAAANGESGKMVLLKRVSDLPYTCITDTADVHNIANFAKTVPDSMINADGDYVTAEFIEYCSPLVMGEASQFMANGLPMHIKL